MQAEREHEPWAIEQAAQQGFIARGKSSIVLIYTLLGPAIGGVMTTSSLIIDPYLQNAAPDTIADYLEILSWSLIFVLSAIIYGSFFGYWFGGVQAFACGLLLAAMSNREGRFGYFHAGLAAAITAGVAMAIYEFAFGWSLGEALFFVSAGLPTSLLLRFLFRKKFAPVKSP